MKIFDISLIPLVDLDRQQSEYIGVLLFVTESGKIYRPILLVILSLTYFELKY